MAKEEGTIRSVCHHGDVSSAFLFGSVRSLNSTNKENDNSLLKYAMVRTEEGVNILLRFNI